MDKEVMEKPVAFLGDTQSGAITKDGIAIVAHQLAKRVNDGDASALDVFIKARALKEICVAIEKKVMDAAMEESASYGKEDSKRFGVEFQSKNGKRSFKYKDSTLDRLLEEEASAKKAREERQDMLKALTGEVADTETGEVLKPAEVSYGKSILALTIPLSAQGESHE